jgi:ATP-dependent RNA helicase DeaD
VQTLILCPTRELAVQVSGQINLLGKYMGVKALPIYGGAGYGDQIAGLKRGATVVVGTPGRVIDHMEKGTLKLNQLKTLILDEADEMISMGFKEELESVLDSVPEGQANKWMFSATMSPEVRRVADTYLVDPKFVQVNRKEMLPTSVEQIYYITKESNKPEVLCKIIDAAEDFYGIIFCQTKALVVDLNQYLLGRGYKADCLHGDMDQNSRDRTMKSFRDRKAKILVATDVACRGLDVNDISHVVNYSIPRELDNYVHRIGRTGRIGKSGLALSLVTTSHRDLIGKIERMTKTKMKEGVIPTRRDVGVKKLSKSLTSFQAQVKFIRAVELLDDAWREALVDMEKDEIVGRFLSILHPEVFSERELPGLPGNPNAVARPGTKRLDGNESSSSEWSSGSGSGGGGYRGRNQRPGRDQREGREGREGRDRSRFSQQQHQRPHQKKPHRKGPRRDRGPREQDSF